jgi:tRNA threonylcarbamoyladenosine biosynthesis protein TsaB
MRTLALDTSTTGGSLALLQDAVVVWDALLPLAQRTAQSFAAMIDTGLVAAGWAPSDIGLVAVTRGPGSFTGLRISVTAAKFFAYATDAAVVAVNTLDVLVEQLPSDVPSACALMDAQRGQFFAAMYTRPAGGPWSVNRPCQIVDRHEIAEHLPPHTLLTGPGLAKVSADWLPEHPRSSVDVWTPRASQVGLCALRDYQAGVRTDIWQLRPEYYRPSYAEEGGKR